MEQQKTHVRKIGVRFKTGDEVFWDPQAVPINGSDPTGAATNVNTGGFKSIGRATRDAHVHAATVEIDGEAPPAAQPENDE